MSNEHAAPSTPWKQLAEHQQTLQDVHIRDLFAQDAQRFSHFSLHACDLLLDYSKHRINGETRDLLVALAKASKLENWRDKLFNGEAINHTENRAALHIALRNRSSQAVHVAEQDVMPGVREVLEKMRGFCERVQSGEWLGFSGKPIENIVNIGIGGSDLGPKMIVEALHNYHHPRLRAWFDSNIDATQLDHILERLDPETTLFIVASKTFSTQETLTNARSARQWLLAHFKDDKAVSKHFVAVSTHTQRVRDFGIDTNNMFAFWDWVGGRYSLWSAIGLSVAVMIGMDNFEALLGGAHDMDEHFRTAPLAENMPVIMGLLGVWYRNFWQASTLAILPYDYSLKYLPFYFQQLEMESNGKRVRRNGEPVKWDTCPVIWGTSGNNGQHAYYQLLHQGTQLIPADFIVAIESQAEDFGHQNAVLANALAQSRALMQGRNEAETRAALGDIDEDLLPHRVFPGNQPSSLLLYKKLSPKILGSLVALYEHKVFVQSVCWDINPFDQWGVELGKQMASELLPALEGKTSNMAYDGSTNGLLDYIQQQRK
ncbi:glucose-6-phosphate isomerase [Candidatus Venteria ishoeyi]|uniref:glucose-6-phosphate isomerase n=1 Tax=Candidatus Venteria ishoeyi TaxID=1899563 RepID=UPI0025A68294|nr:glucose-6-phosphate isomerase [Candidatus Venteria ishoeyi]MDM8547249.1 glucose-6-phosphate isomerase [Candidatus Venteria ishoeyi]